MPKEWTLEQSERRDTFYASLDAAPRDTPTEHAVADIFAAALRQFDVDFPGTRRPTAEHHARERFIKACHGKTDDPRFAGEAPGFARLLLCQEHARFNEYAR